MDEIWFEEILAPTDDSINDAVTRTQRSHPSDVTDKALSKEIRDTAKGVVRIHKPRWIELDPDEKDNHIISSDSNSRFYLVKFGFEFEIIAQAKLKQMNFVYARCMARLRPLVTSQPHPTVYEVMPTDLYDATNQNSLSIELGPQISGFSLGKISTALRLGRLEPVVTGFKGNNETEPYWELRPKSKSLIGVRNVWLIIEIPVGCDGALLKAGVHGKLEQELWGVIPIGSKSWEKDISPTLTILKTSSS